MVESAVVGNVRCCGFRWGDNGGLVKSYLGLR